MIVAIDGPAGSGKSTVARMAAAALGYGYLDTGAMYRAVTSKALELGVSMDDEQGLADIANSARIAFRVRELPEPVEVKLDGSDVTLAVRSPEVSANVSFVSRVPGVREAMVREQRRVAGLGDTVVEGRDIGTVVFPEAQVKIYLTASVEERARRRHGDFAVSGHEMDPAALGVQMARRDRIDSTRVASPLRKADDAAEIDTTEMGLEEVVERVLSLVRSAVSST